MVRALAPTGQGAVPSILPFFAGLRVRRGHGQQVCCQIGKVLWPCEATNWSRLSQCTVGVPINEVYKLQHLFVIKVAGGYEKFVCLFTFKLSDLFGEIFKLPPCRM